MFSKIVNDESDQLGSVIYISHGGGPWPLLGEPRHRDLIGFLEKVPSLLIKPSAIFVISGHWEESRPTVNSGVAPSLFYDYSGFPEESYRITYPAPGDPLLADKIVKLLENHGIQANYNDHRGFDHGVFVPLKIMYPEATIPCVQLSLVNSLDPAEHIRIGRALSDLLEEENLLIIGSGASFHNLRAFHEEPTEEAKARNESFETWLIDTLSSDGLSEKERAGMLEKWESAPAARYCHPREEHLLPLHVCYGICSAAARQVFEIELMGKKTSSYIW